MNCTERTLNNETRNVRMLISPSLRVRVVTETSYIIHLPEIRFGVLATGCSRLIRSARTSSSCSVTWRTWKGCALARSYEPMVSGQCSLLKGTSGLFPKLQE